MKRLALSLMLLVSFAAVVIAGDAPEKKDAPKKRVFRITCLPDDSASRLKERYEALAKRLGALTDYDFEYLPVEDYSAAVTTIATGKADIAMLGGVTVVQADKQADGKLEVLCCRDVDKEFETVFIAPAVEGEQPDPWEDLKPLVKEGKDKSLTFGSKGSMSGHMMPRYYLHKQTEKTPEEIFKSLAYAGSHTRALNSVADGSADFGALNSSVFDKADEDVRKKVRLVYRTPKYADYAFVIREDAGEETIKKIRKAFLDMTTDNAEDKKVLDSLRAGKFVEADMNEWEGVRWAIDSGVDFGG